MIFLIKILLLLNCNWYFLNLSIFQAEDGIRDLSQSRGLGDVYKRQVLGLDESTIELGIKLSMKNNTPLPILLWSYGMLTIEELDKLYSFLFQKMD